MPPSVSTQSPIRQLVLDATAVDGAAPGGQTRGQGGRGGRARFENHQLPTSKQLRAVKALGKRSNENIRELYDVIMERLAYPSSHVRVCALEMYEVLFARSSAFRRLGCDRLDTMVARTIVGKLPSPHAYAEELQHRALELLRRWNREFGSVQPKLGLACRYLESLGLFAALQPDDGNMASDDAVDTNGAGRTVNRPVSISPMERAVEEFRASVAQWRILVTELENARVVLESSRKSHKNTEDNKCALGEGNECDDDDEAWEEVGEDGDLTDDVYVPLLESYREASSETIPKLQRIIGACREMYTSGYDARVSGVLQEAVELNAALVTACSAYERKLGDTVRQAREKRKPGDRNRDDRDHHHTDLGRGSNGDAARERRRGRQGTNGATSTSPSINPMQLIRDPTMPRQRPKAPKSQTDVHAGSDVRSSAGGEKQSVLKKLAAVAPIVPAGGFAGVWDSHAPTTAVLGQTMEVTNHWGPVDVTKELPKDRLDALFLIDQTKIKYGPSGSGGGQGLGGGGIGNQGGAPPDAPCHKPPQTNQPTSNRTSSTTNLASARLTDRNEERRFNEEVLRRASAAAQFGFISRPDDHTSQDPSSQGPRTKRKLRVKESLTKKLKLK